MTTVSAHEDVDAIGKKKDREFPGEEGIWIFVCGDLIIFSLFFCVFTYARSKNVELFNQSQQALAVELGALNMVLLLCSSWFVATAVNELRHKRPKAVPWLLSGTFLLGFGFVVVKIIEYSDKINHGIGVNTNDFYMYYYIFTAIHFLHLLVGLAVIFALILKSRNHEVALKETRSFEVGGIFWHMVDLLWIVLFSLIYLVK